MTDRNLSTINDMMKKSTTTIKNMMTDITRDKKENHSLSIYLISK